MAKHSMRTIGGLGLATLLASVLALALVPTDTWWWIVRIPGILTLVLAALTLLIHPAPNGPAWHRMLGTLAIVAVSLHILAVATFEPAFWRWLTWAIPIEIICGLVAALSLFAALTIRRSLNSPKALLLHRSAGFTVTVAASAHVALIAGTDMAILGLMLAGTLLLVAAALSAERRKLILIAMPALLTAIAATLVIGPLSAARLEALRSSPVDHARFSHDDHAQIVCTTCHHNFIDLTGRENCITCHKRLSIGEGMRVDRLFHAFCGDCHRRDRTAARKSAPIDHCTACHGS